MVPFLKNEFESDAIRFNPIVFSSDSSKFYQMKINFPGGPAGHFMAIGNEFIGAENLEIHVNGGAGGPGQHGGKGTTFLLLLLDNCHFYVVVIQVFSMFFPPRQRRGERRRCT